MKCLKYQKNCDINKLLLLCIFYLISLSLCDNVNSTISHAGDKPVLEPKLHVNNTNLNNSNNIKNNNNNNNNNNKPSTPIEPENNGKTTSVVINNSDKSNNQTVSGLEVLKGHVPSLNSGAVKRAFYVFVGLSILSVAYLLFRSTRLRQGPAQMVRKYGVLAHKQDIEMRPLPLDEEDEDDTVVFDASGLSKQFHQAS